MGHPCVGIDLGTTYSALAVVNQTGRPEIVPNKAGERLTRSAVYFEEGGAIRFGRTAHNAASGYPDRVVECVKRQMGDEAWRFSVDGRSYSAIEISGMILKKVKKDAEERLGAIRYAVVTVPAYFDEPRRAATIAAAGLAGIEVKEIVNEPTAAAVAYASAGQPPGTLLVYDFGGGTFDVSVVRVGSMSDVEVLAAEGDHMLGGMDLDEKLAGSYSEHFEKSKGVRIQDDEGKWRTLLDQAERDKHDLSDVQSIKPMLQWGGQTLTIRVQRSAFDELIADEITRTKMLVENALDEADLQPHDIDNVLLVGGSTRIPAVKQMLTDKFGKPPIAPLPQDEAVALGAALRAGMLLAQQGISDLSPAVVADMQRKRKRDVVAHSLGTRAMVDIGGAQRERIVHIIRKNTPIPVTKKKTFYTMHDGQTAVDCSVTQGEDEEVALANFLFRRALPLPPGRPAGRPIEACYSYDANGVMEFVFTDVESARSVEIKSDVAMRMQARVEEVEADFDDLEIE